MSRRRLASTPTEADLERWWRLIKIAGGVAKSPQGQLRQLDRAALRAKSAVMPVGYQGAESPFVVLCNLAARWIGSTAAERERTALQLGELAKRCAVILTEPVVVRRHRADVDG